MNQQISACLQAYCTSTSVLTYIHNTPALQCLMQHRTLFCSLHYIQEYLCSLHYIQGKTSMVSPGLMYTNCLYGWSMTLEWPSAIFLHDSRIFFKHQCLGNTTVF